MYNLLISILSMTPLKVMRPSLIIKTFEAKGFDIRYPKYKVCKDEDGEEYYHYTWILTKLASYNEEDDLPF